MPGDAFDRLRSALAGHYEIVGLCGRGGMAEVFRAWDIRNEREVAIKVLDRQVTSGLAVARFLREIRIAARLTHTHIVPLYDSGEAGGLLYYVMPLIDGPTLADLLQANQRWSPNDVIRHGTDLAEALDYAHEREVVHRDIKPGNILISAGRAVLSDFGLARALDAAGDRSLTAEHWALGTPVYMSPEQAMGDSHDVDGRADIYALGCVLFEAVTGVPPFEGKSVKHLLAQKVSAEISARWEALSHPVPVRLRRVLLRAMAPAPGDRYQSAAAFRDALQTVRHPRLFRLLGPALVILAVAGVLVAWLVTRDSEPMELAPRRVVVAALDNLTGVPDLDQIGSMAADWITQGLQASGHVETVPTHTARHAERYLEEEGGAIARADPITALARSTGAGLVVSGTLYRQGDSLHVQLQLIDAREGRVAAALAPILGPMDDPMVAVAEARSRTMGLLAVHLDRRIATAPGSSASPPDYRAYQKFDTGLSLYSRYEFEQALEQFRAAREADPEFLQAWLFESLMLSNLNRWAEADTLLALVADQSAGLSPYDRHWLEFRRFLVAGDRPRALQAIASAAELAPISKASYNLAVEAMENGRLDIATQAIENLKAHRGPMLGSVLYLRVAATVYHLAGLREEERWALDEMARDFPDHFWRPPLEAAALAASGRYRDAAAIVDRSVRTGISSERFTPLALSRQVADEILVHGGPEEIAHAALGRGLRWWELQSESRARSPAMQKEAVEVLRRLRRFEAADSMLDVMAGRAPDDLELVMLQGSVAAAANRGGEVAAVWARLDDWNEPYVFGLPSFGLARIAALEGQADVASNLLRGALREGFYLGPRVHQEPDFSAIRGESAFVAVAEPWRSSFDH